jgi:hypothetical protein
MNQPDRLAYSVNEVVGLSGMCRTSIYKMIRRGELETVDVLSRKLIVGASARRRFGGAK